MFRGLSLGQIDSKGRITIPANYRTMMMEEASGSLVVTIDTEERCLLLYPFPAWQAIEEKLESEFKKIILLSALEAEAISQRIFLGKLNVLPENESGEIAKLLAQFSITSTDPEASSSEEEHSSRISPSDFSPK